MSWLHIRERQGPIWWVHIRDALDEGSARYYPVPVLMAVGQVLASKKPRSTPSGLPALLPGCLDAVGSRVLRPWGVLAWDAHLHCQQQSVGDRSRSIFPFPAFWLLLCVVWAWKNPHTLTRKGDVSI